MTDENELTHAIDDAIGANDDSMWRGRPYDGQPHTDTGKRGATEVKGVTFRDLRDCYIRAWCLSGGIDVEPNKTLYYRVAEHGEHALVSENDLYKLDMNEIDLMAVWQNFACEVEKIMGIFPNVENLMTLDDVPIIGSIGPDGFKKS